MQPKFYMTAEDTVVGPFFTEQQVEEHATKTGTEYYEVHTEQETQTGILSTLQKITPEQDLESFQNNIG